MTETHLIATLRAADAAVSGVPTEVPIYAGLDGLTAIEGMKLIAHLETRVATVKANLAGQIQRLSAPELGSQGLAQSMGLRTPVELVKVTTGSTGRDARTAVEIGVVAHEAAGSVDIATGEAHAPKEPWLAPAASALVAGDLSVLALNAIKAGIGVPTQNVTESMLLAAVVHLIEQAKNLDPDRLHKEAKATRAEIDEIGIIDREKAQYEKRFARLWVDHEGMTNLHLKGSGIDAAMITNIVDRFTSPKRGGVRFVAGDGKTVYESIKNDPRTSEQLAFDGILHLLNAGSNADDSQMLGTGAPIVTVAVTRDDLNTIETIPAGENPVGAAFIQGQDEPVSLITVERLLCESFLDTDTYSPSGKPLDHEREQRLYSKKQKANMATTWGECADPNCSAPPSWCEAHHIQHWKRDHGKTNVEDGILLCRHHHLLYHNNHWEIVREGTRYWLVPPAEISAERIELKPKGKAFVRMMKQNALKGLG